MNPSPRMLFVIGAPRSGTTMLERMLAAHSMVLGGPEPHLMTPLAHLGVWAKVDKAPYDHVLAAEAQRGFVSRLPNGEADYWAACRAYADRLYGVCLEARGGGKTVCMDKTPAYGLILPFLARVYPDAKYVVLTRHPLALFSSFANSFFDGDYPAAHAYNPILARYVPALAEFLRAESGPARLHVRYEDLVADPETWFERICAHAEIPYEPGAIDYGETAPEKEAGLGDPIGVKRHTRPSGESVAKWAGELAADPEKRRFMEAMIARLDPADLQTLGYPAQTLWEPLAAAGAQPPKTPKRDRYRLQRKLIIRLRHHAQQNGPFRQLLLKARLALDVLLRE